MADITPKVDRMDNIGIVVGLPMIGRPVTPEWALTLSCFQYPMGCSYKLIITKGLPIDQARNGLVQAAKDLKADYIFFLDDDVLPPVDVLRHLYPVLAKNPKVAAVAGIYPSKTNPPEPLVYKKIGKGCFYDWKYGEIFEAEGLATGCMLINMKIFDKIEQPYFKTLNEDPTGTPRITYFVTDDLYFCSKVLDAGYKLMAHGGVVCTQWDITWPPGYEPKEYKLSDYMPIKEPVKFRIP